MLLTTIGKIIVLVGSWIWVSFSFFSYEFMFLYFLSKLILIFFIYTIISKLPNIAPGISQFNMSIP